MIKKELFIDCLEKIKAYSDKESIIYDSSNGFIDFTSFNELQEMITAFIDLLSYCVKAVEVPYVGTDVDYFIYETNWGTNHEKYHMTDKNGNIISIKNIEDLWNYFAALNPDIVDVEE